MKLSLIMRKGHTILGSIYEGYSHGCPYRTKKGGGPVRWPTVDLPSHHFSKTTAFYFGDGKFKAPLALNGDTSAFKLTVSW